MENKCNCKTGNCEWVYSDGCKIYGLASPHGCVGTHDPSHEHELITATQCWHCGDVIEFNPPAKTINEANERAEGNCSCGKDIEDASKIRTPTADITWNIDETESAL